jgi:hypothetical protein
VDSLLELSKPEIEARADDFLTLHAQDIRLLPGWRADLSKKPLAVLKWVLAQAGIKIASRQFMQAQALLCVLH